VAGLPRVIKALREIDIYIGDGAKIKRAMVRRRGRTLIGRASIVAPLAWCKRAGGQVRRIYPLRLRNRAGQCTLARHTRSAATTLSMPVWRVMAIACYLPIDTGQRVRRNLGVCRRNIQENGRSSKVAVSIVISIRSDTKAVMVVQQEHTDTIW
jgi:hypothetical protein